MSKRKGNDKRSVTESQSVDLNEGIETRPSEIRSSKIVDREQINSSVNRERSQLPTTSTICKKCKSEIIHKDLAASKGMCNSCYGLYGDITEALQIANSKRKDKYELIDEIMSANEKGKIYVDDTKRKHHTCKILSKDDEVKIHTLKRGNRIDWVIKEEDSALIIFFCPFCGVRL